MKKALFFTLLTAVNFSSFSQSCSVNIIKFQNMGECQGKEIQLIASPINQGNIYQWSCPNPAFNSTTGPFLYIPYAGMSDMGDYTLTVTDSNACIAIAVVHVNVIPKPIVSISGQSFACYGTTTALYANDLSGNYGPYSYNWDNGFTTQSINILHNGGVSPHPSCIITNAAGCSAPNQTSFMIGTQYPPFASISYTGLTSFCAPANLELSAPVGSQIYYQWRKNGVNIAGAVSADYKATKSGKYKVVVSDIYGCSAVSDFVHVTVFPKPSASVSTSGPLVFCNGDSVILAAAPGTGYVYQWKRNGVPVHGSTNMTFAAKTAGNYRVEITSNNDCYRLSDLKTVAINCRENEKYMLQNQALAAAFPNPASDEFTLHFLDNNLPETQIQVFDVLGHLVFSSQGNFSTEGLTFGGNLQPGMYSARITQINRSQVLRLIKN